MKNISNILSILFYPLFVPTYGVAFFCYAYAQRVLYMPMVWVWVAIIGTFLLTCLLPLSAILILMRQGRITDLQITNARERTMPYIYTLFGFGCWSYLMIAVLHAPLSMGLVSVGATVALALVAFINRRWKISAHLTGLGGLVGGVMSYCLEMSQVPSVGLVIGLLALCLIVMYARLYLHAHTPAQVCAGWLLGLSCTFLPYCLLNYAV